MKEDISCLFGIDSLRTLHTISETKSTVKHLLHAGTETALLNFNATIVKLGIVFLTEDLNVTIQDGARQFKTRMHDYLVCEVYRYIKNI
jgi:hypothetical protein